MGVVTPTLWVAGIVNALQPPSRNLKKFKNYLIARTEYFANVLFICISGWLNAKFSEWHFNTVNSTASHGAAHPNLAERDHCKHWSLPPIYCLYDAVHWHDCCWCSSIGQIDDVDSSCTASSLMMMTTMMSTFEIQPRRHAAWQGIHQWLGDMTATDQSWLRLV